MFDWILNTLPNTITICFPGVSKLRLMTFSIFFHRLTFATSTCQRLRHIEDLGAFSQNVFILQNLQESTCAGVSF